MHLYEFEGAWQDIAAALAALDLFEGEERDAEEARILDQITALEEDFDGKVENILKVVRGLDAEIDALKAERDRMSARAKSRDNARGRLRMYLQDNMTRLDIDKVKTLIGTAYMGTVADSVDVVKPEELPDEWKTVEVVEKPRKKDILDHYKKTGEILPGCEIVSGRRTVRIR